MRRNSVTAKVLLVTALIWGRASIAECGMSNDLSTQQEQLLARYGIILHQGSLLVSSKIVSDCTLRTEASEFLSHTIIGNGPTPADQRFAAQHEELISMVVQKTWGAIANSPAVPADGTLRHDKWAVLRNPNVRNAVVAEIALSSVHVGGFSPDVTYLLLLRPVPELRDAVKKEISSSKAPVNSRLFALAVLSRISLPDAKQLSGQMETLEALNSEQTKVLQQLTNRFSRDEAARWDDVSVLAVEEM